MFSSADKLDEYRSSTYHPDVADDWSQSGYVDSAIGPCDFRSTYSTIILKRCDAAASSWKAMKIRAWHRKSRGGCLTCKKRHLKCDETRPECLRCLRSSRTCLRYEQSNESDQHEPNRELNFIHYDSKLMTPGPTVISTNVIESERHLVAFFAHVTVPLLTQCFHGGVWRGINVKSLLSNPAFKEVAIACASHHLSFVRRNSAGHLMVDDVRLLRQYCKALRAHQDLIVHGTDDNAGALMATVLLVVLESLRGSNHALKKHLIGGLRLLKTNHYGLDEELRLQLLQLYVASSLSTVMRSSDFELRMEIENISLEEFCSQSSEDDYDFLRAVSEFAVVQIYCYLVRNALNAFDSEESRVSKHSMIVEKLDLIQNALDSGESSGRSRKVVVDNVIGARVLLCRIYLRASSSFQQMSYDEHASSFRQIVDLLREALHHRSQETVDLEWPNSFSVGLGMIPLLQITVQQCRDPQIRRDALQLLELCPRREGLWDAGDSHRIGEAVISFEEKETETDGDVVVIPERNRIHYALLDQTPDQPARTVLYVLCGPLHSSPSVPVTKLTLS